MGAPSEYYVDPSLGSDTGDGTVGTPWGRATGSVIQYALDTGITRDATNGDRINIKAGTDDVLAANVSFATYGVPTASAAVIFQGYTATANDGGIGGIDGNGSFGINSGNTDFMRLVDLHIHNSGAGQLLHLDNDVFVLNCEFNNSTHATSVSTDDNSQYFGCHFHDIKKVEVLGDSTLANCYFKNDGTSDFTQTINFTGGIAIAINNIFSLDGGSDAITLSSGACRFIGNSILSSSGTGTGITLASTAQNNKNVYNNMIEGFSGAGGIGIEFNSGTGKYGIYAGNALFNNTTDEANTVAGMWGFENDNEALGSTPFSKSGADTFANRYTYFKPADVGNVYNGAYPSGSNFDKGAVQHDAAGGLIPIFRSNSLITR